MRGCAGNQASCGRLGRSGVTPRMARLSLSRVRIAILKVARVADLWGARDRTPHVAEAVAYQRFDRM